MGMWGADDPDNRKPLWWEDIDMKSETPIDPRGGQYQDKPAFDQQQFDYLVSLCHLRKNHIALQKGSYAFIRSWPAMASWPITEKRRMKNDGLDQCRAQFQNNRRRSG